MISAKFSSDNTFNANLKKVEVKNYSCTSYLLELSPFQYKISSFYSLYLSTLLLFFFKLCFRNLHLKFNDWAHVTATPFKKKLVSDLMWLLLVFMMPYLHNLYIIINRRIWGIIFRQYLWNILMFILSYPTTESPFRLKNVPSDVTFLLQIDKIFGHFTKTYARKSHQIC
jgi:hypothetical protein